MSINKKGAIMAFTDRYLIIDTVVLVNRLCAGMKLYLMNEINGISGDEWSSLLEVVQVENHRSGNTEVVLCRPHDKEILHLEIDRVGKLVMSDRFRMPIGFKGHTFFVERGLETADKLPICSFCQVPTRYSLSAEICPKCGWNYTQNPIPRER